MAADIIEHEALPLEPVAVVGRTRQPPAGGITSRLSWTPNCGY